MAVGWRRAVLSGARWKTNGYVDQIGGGPPIHRRRSTGSSLCRPGRSGRALHPCRQLRRVARWSAFSGQPAPAGFRRHATEGRAELERRPVTVLRDNAYCGANDQDTCEGYVESNGFHGRPGGRIIDDYRVAEARTSMTADPEDIES